jgi:DegV family protein with EDD domain
MEKIAWVTDSTCGLPQSFIEEHDIHVLPMIVHINNISYREDIEISKEEVYELLKQYGEGAKTSQPAYGEFVTLYEQLAEADAYDKVIAIHASSALTGTYQSSVSASQMVDLDVEVIDSKVGSFALGQMIRKGIHMAQAGKSTDEIVKTIHHYTDHLEMYLLPQSLEQMRKSGRVSTTQSVFANLLSINIILRFDKGKIIIDDKIRSKKKAVRYLFQAIEKAYKSGELTELGIMHAGAKERAEEWKKELLNMYENLKIQVEPLVPVAGVHAGHGTMAISWLKEN